MSDPARPIFSADEPLPLTGERTTPGIAEETYWFQRHVVAYRWAAERVRGLRVLDAGCGEGYGSDLLAGAAASVTGVDIEEAVVNRAARRYPRVRLAPADLGALPYGPASFDAVVSLQVVEHVPQPSELLRECARVLAPGGVLIMATPNRLTFSPHGLRNPFHTFEFSPGELREMLRRTFPRGEMLGVYHGPRIRAMEAVLRAPLPERLIAQPAPDWPRWLRAFVAGVRAEDFRIRPGKLARSLDLIAVARRDG